jgi:altronate dehydratase large subunit
MADNIDFDASGILEKSDKAATLGEKLYAYAIDVASGTRTTSELLDVRETAISRFAPTI